MCFIWGFNILRLLFCSPETLVFPNLSEEKLWILEKKIKTIGFFFNQYTAVLDCFSKHLELWI